MIYNLHEQRNIHKDLFRSSNYRDSIIYHGPSNKKVALTFDDGPDNDLTAKILDVLSQYNVKATFMCEGIKVQQNPKILKRIISEGHMVGNHSWNHPDLTTISLTEVRDQIESTNNKIYELIGIKPRFFRPPYGRMNDEVIEEIVSLGFDIVLWNIDSMDWTGLTGPQVAAKIIPKVDPGTIVLQHNDSSGSKVGIGTKEALNYIIEILSEDGYDFVTVSELLDIPAYIE